MRRRSDGWRMYPPGGPYPHPERPEGEPAPAALDPEHVTLSDPVYAWRAERLEAAGMTQFQSRALALDRRVDVAWVIDVLLARGCDPAVAFDIASN